MGDVDREKLVKTDLVGVESVDQNKDLPLFVLCLEFDLTLYLFIASNNDQIS